jgi:hypothetical protein
MHGATIKFTKSKICFMAFTRKGLKDTTGIWATGQAGS